MNYVVKRVLLNLKDSYLIVSHISAKTQLVIGIEYSLVQKHYWLGQT
jgi:hypothetical protein